MEKGRLSVGCAVDAAREKRVPRRVEDGVRDRVGGDRQREWSGCVCEKGWSRVGHMKHVYESTNVRWKGDPQDEV